MKRRKSTNEQKNLIVLTGLKRRPVEEICGEHGISQTLCNAPPLTGLVRPWFSALCLQPALYRGLFILKDPAHTTRELATPAAVLVMIKNLDISYKNRKFPAR